MRLICRTAAMLGFTVLAISSSMARADIYKHVDEHGNVTFVPKPIKGAVLILKEPGETAEQKKLRLAEEQKRKEIQARPAPVIGMSLLEVGTKSNWGEPKGKLKRVTTQQGVTERWRYAKGQLVFVNGRLAEIHE